MTSKSYAHTFKGLLKLLRPHQWVKNLFVLAPMFFHKDLISKNEAGVHVLNLEICGRALLATMIFSLLAGAVYTLNDFVDAEADRLHPVKKNRPIASYLVSEALAKWTILALVSFSLISAFSLNKWFGLTSLIYFLENVAYSFKLKKIAFIDVSLIAAGFVLRVIAGGFATDTEVSWYMLLCTALLALFLGFGKRRHELSLENAEKQRSALKTYSKKGLDFAMALTGLGAAITYCAYTLDPSTKALFHSDYLWLTAPFTAFGLLRFVMLVRDKNGEGKKAESPTQAMLSDVPFVLNLVVWLLLAFTIIYKFQPSS